MNVRAVPWLVALGGLAIPLVGSGGAGWPFVVAWLVILALACIVGRRTQRLSRREGIAIAVILLPVLFVLAWEGGWWLIPADVAWLLVNLANGGGEREANVPGAAA